MGAKNDFVSVDILAHAVAKPELDDGLDMEELEIIMFVVALFLWCVQVVHALLVLAFTTGLTTFIEWVDPKVYDVTSWAKSYPAGPLPFWCTADRDATDHFYAFHPDGTEKWFPPLQVENSVGYLECAERREASGDSQSGLAIARLRSSEFTTPLSYYAIDSCPSVEDGSGTVQLRQWTCTFQVASPLLRCCAASHPPQKRQGATPDFTASSLLQQCFLEPPAIVRLQVRSLMTIRQHEDAEEPGETSSTGGNVTPPSIMASGLTLYWRCADGEGIRLRGSGGCGRVGTLVGDTSWLEPLPADELLAAADEWGTAMALSCAVNLGAGEKLVCIPDSGMHKSMDRNMLSLVGGDRTGEDGVRCVEEKQQRGPGDEDSCNMWSSGPD